LPQPPRKGISQESKGGIVLTFRRLILTLALLAGASSSPDATEELIVFSARDDSGYFHLYSIKPDGTELRKLTFGKNNDTSVQLSQQPGSVGFLRVVGDKTTPLVVTLPQGKVSAPAFNSSVRPPLTAPSGRYYFTEDQSGCKVFRSPGNSEISVPLGFAPLLWLDDDRLFGYTTEAGNSQYALWDLRENALRAYRKPEFAPDRRYIRVPGMLQYIVVATDDPKTNANVYEWLDVYKGKKMDFVSGRSLSFANDGSGSHCYIALNGRLMAARGRLGNPKVISPKGWQIDSCLWVLPQG
jgi:hypothetical protein